MSATVLHKKSNVVVNDLPLLPEPNELQVGEIAVNYGAGHEALAIKNDDDEVVAFYASEETERIIASAFNTLNGELNEEINRATSAETILNGLIASETARAQSAETQLYEAISGETARATGVEAGLNTRVGELEDHERAVAAALTQLNDEIAEVASGQTELEERVTAIEEYDEEVIAAAIAHLDEAISGETARATSAESVLSTAILNETTRATSAETQLYDKIDDEKSALLTRIATLEEALERMGNVVAASLTDLDGRVVVLEVQSTEQTTPSTGSDGYDNAQVVYEEE